MTMHVEWFNHFPLAKKLARDVDVRWGEHRGMALTIAELKKRGAKRVGLMGPLLPRKQRELEKEFAVVELDAEYVRLRLIKSEEEIDWLRIGAAFSDAGFESLLAGTRSGHDGARARQPGRARLRRRGRHHLHPLHRRHLDGRRPTFSCRRNSIRRARSEQGDVVFCELSGTFWDYSGQVLRTFSVGPIRRRSIATCTPPPRRRSTP